MKQEETLPKFKSGRDVPRTFSGKAFVNGVIIEYKNGSVAKEFCCTEMSCIDPFHRYGDSFCYTEFFLKKIGDKNHIVTKFQNGSYTISTISTNLETGEKGIVYSFMHGPAVKLTSRTAIKVWYETHHPGETIPDVDSIEEYWIDGICLDKESYTTIVDVFGGVSL